MKSLAASVVAVLLISAVASHAQSSSGSANTGSQASVTAAASSESSAPATAATTTTAAPATAAATTTAAPSSTANASVGLQYLIVTSYSLNSSHMDCVNDNPTEEYCNNTQYCYWNSTMNLCLDMEPAPARSNETVANTDAWCVGHIPTPVVSAVYMVGAFVMGFAVSGFVYNAMWYDTYSRVNDAGERQFNQFYYSTAPMNLYCIFIVVTCGFMFFFTFVNQFYDAQSCVYVVWIYVFVVGFFVPAVTVPMWLLVLFIMKKCRPPPKTNLTLDEWCVPLTQPAIQDPTSCQTRCF